MQIAFKYENTYLTSKNDDLFLTADSLIRLNIITGSQQNVKPASYSKIYMDKSFVEAALYPLVDPFSDRIISHKDSLKLIRDKLNFTTVICFLFARNINLPSTNENMDYIYHGFALKHTNSTDVIIGSNEKCLTPTNKCFVKDPNDVINV